MARKRVEGTHMGDKSNVPNTCLPRTRRQGDTKAEKRLEARVKAFALLKGKPGQYQKPGSLKK